MGRLIRAAIAALLVLASVGTAAAAPRRIVSLNLCADQLILALADREAIAALTWMAQDCEISVRCAEAAGLPFTHGSAEAMVAAQPDLVIAGRYTARPAVAAAKRHGFRVIELAVANDLATVRQQIGTVAEAVGRPERGTALVAAFDARLAAIPPVAAGAIRPVAAVYQANGFTVGTGSLIDTLLTLAGFDNLARRLGIDNYPHLPLESLIAGRPDLLLMDDARKLRPALADAMLRHPALALAFAPERRAVIPQRLWICGGPSVAEAAELLVAARGRIKAAPGRTDS